jgi:putative tributyrin esterase
MKVLIFSFLMLCGFTGYAQEQIVFKSKNLPKPDTTWVFLPKTYNTNQILPIIFLLHGYSGNYKQWNKIMDAQKYADEYNFIIVCPDGLYSSWYINSPAKADSQFESFFFEELYPSVLKKFNADEKNVFITGLSMGGHGALYLFIKKPHLFSAAGSTSGGVNLLDGVGKFGLPALLGNPLPTDPIWQTYSVYNNIDQLKGIDKPIIFDCGADDFFYISNNLLKQKCDSLKLKATYISQPGSHNAAYWSKSIKQQFQFFTNHLAK